MKRFAQFLVYITVLLSFEMVSGQSQILPKPTIEIPTDVDSLTQSAFSHSAQLKAQLADIAEKQESINREYRGWLSSFKMGIQFLNVSQDFDANVTKVGVLPSFGVTIQVDFERFFNIGSNIRSAKFQKEKAQQMYKVQQQTIAIQIQDLVNDMSLSMKQAEIRYQTYFTISDQLTLTEERFKRGEIELGVYLNALNAVEQSKENYYLAYFDLQKKYDQLKLITQEI